MSELTPLAKKIILLKGDMSYEEFSEAIYRKTGKRISRNGLQKLGSANRMMGRYKTIAILAEYADKPLSWFYEEDPPAPEAVAEERTEYLSEKERRANEYKRQLMEEYISKGRKMTPDQLELINKIVDEMIEKNSTKP